MTSIVRQNTVSPYWDGPARKGEVAPRRRCRRLAGQWCRRGIVPSVSRDWRERFVTAFDGEFPQWIGAVAVGADRRQERPRFVGRRYPMKSPSARTRPMLRHLPMAEMVRTVVNFGQCRASEVR